MNDPCPLSYRPHISPFHILAARLSLPSRMLAPEMKIALEITLPGLGFRISRACCSQSDDSMSVTDCHGSFQGVSIFFLLTLDENCFLAATGVDADYCGAHADGRKRVLFWEVAMILGREVSR